MPLYSDAQRNMGCSAGESAGLFERLSEAIIPQQSPQRGKVEEFMLSLPILESHWSFHPIGHLLVHILGYIIWP